MISYNIKSKLQRKFYWRLIFSHC